MEKEGFVERAASSGDRLIKKLRGLESMDGVGHVRGQGMSAFRGEADIAYCGANVCF